MSVDERIDAEKRLPGDSRGGPSPRSLHAAGGPLSLIDRIDAEISCVEAELSSAQARLRKLRDAREVLTEYNGGRKLQLAGDAAKPVARHVTLGDKIEATLSDGPCTRRELVGRMIGAGVQTTEASITTTLSRMRARGDLINSDGKWRLPADRHATSKATIGLVS